MSATQRPFVSSPVASTGGLVAACIMLAAICLIGGCTINAHERGSGHTYSPGYDESSRPPPSYGPRFEVPRYAVAVAEGHQKISIRVFNDGAVYVYDLNNGERILSRTLRDGDRFVFDPDKNKAFVNNKTIYDQDINSKHVYRIYFDNFGRSGRYERF